MWIEQRRLKSFWLVVFLVTVCAENFSSLQAIAEPVPQLIYFTRNGLDVKNNKIDELINTFGFACEHIANFPKACRIETELTAFLSMLSPTRADVTRELNALGAVCDAESDRLHCIHRRHVESAGWFVGSSVPVKIIDDFFRIDLTISGEDGALRFEAKFNRTERTRSSE
jgi:hypothetical protein